MPAILLSAFKIFLDKRVIIALFISSVFLYAYLIITENQSLRLENKTVKQELKERIEKEKIYIVKIKETIALNKKIEEEKLQARKLVDELRQKLYRENLGKKSLETLAQKKPLLIEKKVNSATKEMLRCIEKSSRGEEC